MTATKYIRHARLYVNHEKFNYTRRVFDCYTSHTHTHTSLIICVTRFRKNRSIFFLPPPFACYTYPQHQSSPRVCVRGNGLGELKVETSAPSAGNREVTAAAGVPHHTSQHPRARWHLAACARRHHGLPRENLFSANIYTRRCENICTGGRTKSLPHIHTYISEKSRAAHYGRTHELFNKKLRRGATRPKLAPRVPRRAANRALSLSLSLCLVRSDGVSSRSPWGAKWAFFRECAQSSGRKAYWGLYCPRTAACVRVRGPKCRALRWNERQRWFW